MPLQVPSIWDYIAGAGSKGIESYQDAHDKLQRQEMEQAGILSQLFGQGAINNTDLMPGLAKIGVNANVLPNAPQIKRESGLQGLETQNAVAGEKVKAQTMYDPVLKQAGENYIDMALVPYGGRVPSNWQAIVDRAWNMYVSANQKEGIPIKPDQRAFFVQRIFERQQEQSKLDLEAARTRHEGTASDAAMINARANMTSAQRQLNMNSPEEKAARILKDKYAIQTSALSRLEGNTLFMSLAQQPGTPQAKMYQDAQDAASATEAELGATTRAMTGYHAPPPSKDVIPPPAKWGTTQHQAAAERILKHQGTIEDLKPYIQSGQITTTDYNLIRDLVIRAPGKKR